jgi:uncharacterized membrane protein YciS (DUF1049 family)
MKKFKIVIWLLIIVFIGVVIYQNKAFFLANEVFHLNLIAKDYITPEIPVAVVFVGFFLCGLLVAFLFSLPGRLRAGKAIRSLNETIRAQSTELAAMKSEVEAIKQPVPPTPEEHAADAQTPPEASS